MRTLPPPPPPAAPAPAQSATPPNPPAPAPPPRRPAKWEGQAVMGAAETAQVAFAAWSGDPAVVVPSPPGAGKTRLVTLLAAYLADRAGLRIGVAAQTREQAVEIARRAGAATTRARLLWSATETPPGCGATPLTTTGKARFPAGAGGILIATTARWLYASPRALGCDVMIVDEAWQATYADLGALGAFARQIVCVGDPGQIDPVVTGTTTRWVASPTGPHLPAPAALRAAHGEAISVVALRHTWRLGPQTTALVQPAFYPGLPFTSRRPAEHIAGPAGIVPEISHRDVTVTGGPTDPALTAACVARVRELLTGHTLTTAEGTRPLTAADVAVVTPHVTQASAVRALLASEPDVLTGTANQLQGLERHAVVVLHPLAGYRDLAGSDFGLDAGRACVMLSRHRCHLTVITDPMTPGILAATGGRAAAGQAALLARLLATPAA